MPLYPYANEENPTTHGFSLAYGMKNDGARVQPSALRNDFLPVIAVRALAQRARPSRCRCRACIAVRGKPWEVVERQAMGHNLWQQVLEPRRDTSRAGPVVHL